MHLDASSCVHMHMQSATCKGKGGIWQLCRQKLMSMTWMTWTKSACEPVSLLSETCHSKLLRAKSGKKSTKYLAATPSVGTSGGSSAQFGQRCTCFRFYHVDLWHETSVVLTPLGDIWLGFTASMGPDVQRNANVSPKFHTYKNDILRGTKSAWLVSSFLLETGAMCGAAVYKVTSTGHQQHVRGNGKSMIFWRMWNHRSTGRYCPDSDPFSTSQYFWPKHRHSFCSESVSVNVMSCPGTTWGVQIHLSKKNIRGQRMTRVVYKSRKFGSLVFMTFIQMAWNDTIQSVPGWCSRKQHSCRLSERQLGRVGKKKQQPGNERKLAGVLSTLSKVCMVPSSQPNSRSPWNWYWWPFASKLSSLTSNVLTDISIRKTMANDPTKVVYLHEFQSSLQFNTQKYPTTRLNRLL